MQRTMTQDDIIVGNARLMHGDCMEALALRRRCQVALDGMLSIRRSLPDEIAQLRRDLAAFISTADAANAGSPDTHAPRTAPAGALPGRPPLP